MKMQLQINMDIYCDGCAVSGLQPHIRRHVIDHLNEAYGPQFR